MQIVFRLALLPLSVLLGPVCLLAQTPAPANPPVQAGSQPVRPHNGGFIEGQSKTPEDPAQVARGKILFEINCRGCHGADLRGGDLGGPNLLRSQAALSDQHGEMIIPIIHGARQKMGMPAIGLSDADAQAVAAYVRSVIATIGGQGRPPDEGRPEPNQLVGNAAEGKAFFAAKCATCHSSTGDLKGLAAHFKDVKKLQDNWVSGGEPDEEEKAGAPDRRTVTAVVTLPSGDKLTGPLIRIDDFYVTVQLPDGTERTISRRDSHPEILIHDPMQQHRDLLTEMTNKDMHDVTAYLATFK